MESFDVIVVGGGVMGHATAWHLVHREAKRVLLLDQFPFPTTRNSSTGHSRIYRCGYDDATYAAMMDAALPLWHDLQRLAGRPILHACGLVYTGPTSVVDVVENAMRTNGSPHERLSSAQLRRRWPSFKGFPATAEAVVDPIAGFIVADAALHAYHELLRASGRCRLQFGSPVTGVEAAGHGTEVRVRTEAAQFSAPTLVLTTGAWSGALLARMGFPLPLEPQRVAVAYYKVKREGDKSFRAPAWPTVILDSDTTHIYAIPEAEYSGMVKVGNHNGIPGDPDRRDRNPAEVEALVRPLTEFVRDHVEGLEPEPAIIEHCLYCTTPDTHYVIDRLPGPFRNVVVGCGFSGHGFKMAPAVGEALGQMAVGKRPTLDISKFSARRFHNKSKL